MDLAVAAASAAGECVVLVPKRHPRAPPPTSIDDDDDLLQYDEAEELPDVDDLEVAAAAAAAAQAALQRAAEAPLYAVPQRVLAPPAPQSMDTDDEEEDEDEGEGEPEVVLALEIVESVGEWAVRREAARPGPERSAPLRLPSTPKNSMSNQPLPSTPRACQHLILPIPRWRDRARAPHPDGRPPRHGRAQPDLVVGR